MKKIACLLLTCLPSFVYSKDTITADTFVEALKYGEPKLAFRLRYEHGSPKAVTLSKGYSITNQSKMGYETLAYRSNHAFLEFTHVALSFTERYNSGIPIFEKPQYIRMYETKGGNLTGCYIENNYFTHTTIRIGRQSLSLDDGRLIGSAPFRQYPRHFDSIKIENSSFPGVKALYAFIRKVNGPHSNLSFYDRSRTHSHLLNLQWQSPWGDISASYLYLKDRTQHANSGITYGLGLSGEKPLSLHYGLSFSHKTRFLQQKGRGRRPPYTANHFAIELGLGLRYCQVKAGIDLSTGNRYEMDKAFRTPLGDQHAHLGWTDRFEKIPDKGLKDTYIALTAEILNVDMALHLHLFRHQHGENKHIGKEINFGLYRKLDEVFSFSIQHALFNANTHNLNYDSERRVWVTLKAQF